jgi:hypothetical protein
MRTEEEKRVYLLLKSVIFNYHGIEHREQQDLEETAARMDALAEMEWANNFIAKDYLTAFERARAYLNEIIGDYPRDKRRELVNMMWESNNLKGYVTEMELTAMIKLARDWNVEQDLADLILK